ncbi:MAG: hypothetical protein U0441_27630 [Polyangiaceae bacterium]
MRARSWLFAVLTSAGALGCSDLLGFGEYDAVCGADAAPAPGGLRWVTRLGDGSVQRGLAAAMDGEGAALVAGSFGGALDTGGAVITSADPQDAYVLKLDAAGAPAWARAFGGSGHQYATALAVDAQGRVFVGGRFDGTMDVCGQTLTATDTEDTDGSADNDEGAEDVDKDGFVIALGRDGACLWSRVIGGLGDQTVTGLAIGAGGALIVSGSFQGTLHPDKPCPSLASQAGVDVFVVGLMEGGACQSSTQLDFGGEDSAEALAVDESGDAWVAGSCENGTLPPCNAGGGKDALLSRVSAAGQVTSWAFGGMGDQAAFSVIARGDVVGLTGKFQGALDFGGASPLFGSDVSAYFARLHFSKDGQIDPTTTTAAAFAGTGPRLGTALAGDPGGLAVVAGDYGGTLDFGGGALPAVTSGDSNIFAAALDETNVSTWSRSFGDGQSKALVSAAATDEASSDVILVGSLNGTTPCGEDATKDTLSSAGSNDLFVARLQMR